MFCFWQDCLPDAESAFYFAGVTYTTIGYGDVVLLKPWRLLGPVFGSRLVRASESAETISLAQFQSSFQPLLVGILLVLILTFLLKETGPAARKT